MDKQVEIQKLRPGQWFLYNNQKYIVLEYPEFYSGMHSCLVYDENFTEEEKKEYLGNNVLNSNYNLLVTPIEVEIKIK